VLAGAGLEDDLAAGRVADAEPDLALQAVVRLVEVRLIPVVLAVVRLLEAHALAEVAGVVALPREEIAVSIPVWNSSLGIAVISSIVITRG
jgi:hypothetical protein